MSNHSRTFNSIRNSVVALSFYAVNLILQFFSRKIFIDFLGTEVLGLNTTATSLLQFLNLAEMGIGNAVAFTLYKPLHADDKIAINEIISLQGWLYRKIALFVIIGSAFLMGFFPYFFSKADLPLWYAFATYSVLLISALLSYYFNYRQILLSASQQEYKLQFSYRGIMILKIIAQIVLIPRWGYIGWLVLELLFSIIATLSLNFSIKKTFPYLKTDISQGKVLKEKYPIIIKKVKQIFFHKIGSYTLSQSTPLIIYGYASLTLVAIYGNYMLIITGMRTLLEAIFNGLNASVGDLVAEGHKDKIVKVFRELFSARFLIIASICFGLWILTDPFISIWVGEQYLLDKTTLLLIITVFYLNTSRSIVNSYIHAYGLFGDVWAPIVEAILNVGMAVLLGRFWGLNGVLLGVIASLVIIVFSWKPYYLFVHGIKTSFSIYVFMQISHLLAFLGLAYLGDKVVSLLPFDFTSSYLHLFGYGSIVIIIFFFILMGILWLVEPGMRTFVRRMMKFVKQ